MRISSVYTDRCILSTCIYIQIYLICVYRWYVWHICSSRYKIIDVCRHRILCALLCVGSVYWMLTSARGLRVTMSCYIMRMNTFSCCCCRKSWCNRFSCCCCCLLQRVAVCCSVLQRVAVYCSVLQCVVVCCNVLQCVVVCSKSWYNRLSWCCCCCWYVC